MRHKTKTAKQAVKAFLTLYGQENRFGLEKIIVPDIVKVPIWSACYFGFSLLGEKLSKLFLPLAGELMAPAFGYSLALLHPTAIAIATKTRDVGMPRYFKSVGISELIATPALVVTLTSVYMATNSAVISAMLATAIAVVTSEVVFNIAWSTKEANFREFIRGIGKIVKKPAKIFRNEFEEPCSKSEQAGMIIGVHALLWIAPILLTRIIVSYYLQDSTDFINEFWKTMALAGTPTNVIIAGIALPKVEQIVKEN